MKHLVVGIGLICVAGCATVTMVPGEASVETELAAPQSALRIAAEDFCATASDKGWASEGNRLFGFAAILMEGETDGERATANYLEEVEAETGDVEVVLERITEDAGAAAEGLAEVTVEARKLLRATDLQPHRKDVTSYERALVQAQKALRAFEEAVRVVSARTEDTENAEQAVAAFAAEIDEARRVADELARRYAAKDDPVVS